MIRVQLPFHLRNLAGLNLEVAEVEIQVDGAPTFASVVDALEARFPALRGTIRDHYTRKRRPWLRFFACKQDFSHEPLDTPLPEPVARGEEPLIVLGAIAGG